MQQEETLLERGAKTQQGKTTNKTELKPGEINKEKWLHHVPKIVERQLCPGDFAGFPIPVLPSPMHPAGGTGSNVSDREILGKNGILTGRGGDN